MTAPTKVLIVKTSSLGDLIHTFPAVTDMAYRVPGLRIDWVAEEAFADIPALHPMVARVIPVALRRWRRHPLHRTVWREWTAFRDALQATNYDLVLDHQGLVKSAVIACQAHGQRRGFDWYSAREPLASLCYHQRYAVAPEQHAVARNRALAALALGYDLPTEPAEYGIPTFSPVAPSSVRDCSERYVVCLHATSRASKMWPTEHWITLGGTLAQQGWSCLLPWGNEAEHRMATALARAIPSSRVLPKRTLRELACVFSGAEWVIGMDTGLTHLAAALGCPTIALYTDTAPGLTGVIANPGGVACNLGGPGQVPMPDQVIAFLRGGDEDGGKTHGRAYATVL